MTKKIKKILKTKAKPKTELVERVSPFENLIDFQKDFFDKDFSNLFRKLNVPSIDVENKKENVEIIADMPGIDKKDIKICVNKDSVEISAEKKIEQNIKNKNYYKQERSYSGYHRVISLPALVDPKKVNCDFKNGTLKIEIKKIKNSINKPKMITLK